MRGCSYRQVLCAAKTTLFYNGAYGIGTEQSTVKGRSLAAKLQPFSLFPRRGTSIIAARTVAKRRVGAPYSGSRGSSDPMIEAGAPSTERVASVLSWVCPPHRG